MSYIGAVFPWAVFVFIMHLEADQNNSHDFVIASNSYEASETLLSRGIEQVRHVVGGCIMRVNVHCSQGDAIYTIL